MGVGGSWIVRVSVGELFFVLFNIFFSTVFNLSIINYLLEKTDTFNVR